MKNHPFFRLALSQRGVPWNAWQRWNKAQDFVFDAITQRPRNEIEVIVTNGEATIYVYDFIGYDPWFGGVSAEEFAKAVDKVSAPVLHIRGNSPGGYVNDGEAMAAAMERKKKMPCEVIFHNDGICASAATFLQMAASKTMGSRGSLLMIHNAMAGVFGNRHDHLAESLVLEKIDSVIADKYVRKTGLSMEQIAQWMDAETWFKAEEAIEHGLMDEIEEAGSQAESANSTAQPPVAASDHVEPPPVESSKYDMATIERRLALIEHIGR